MEVVPKTSVQTLKSYHGILDPCMDFKLNFKDWSVGFHTVTYETYFRE